MASPDQSGYQCKFVESVEDYECPLCLHVTREPSLTSCCGQHFCQACINRIITDNMQCPFCKQNTFTTLLDKKQRRKVLDMKVYCDKKADGCDWVGGLGELEQHLDQNCPFVTVTCPHNCGLALQRRLLDKHQKNDCPMRPHSCQYCQLKGTYQEIQEEHLPICPKCPVQCLNKCGVSSPERGQLKDHLRVCPLQVVECELRELGCVEEVQRKDLARHMEQATQKHLSLMTTFTLMTKKSHDQQINALKKENQDLRREVEERQQKHEKEIVELTNELEFVKANLNTVVLRLTLDEFRKRRRSWDHHWFTNIELLAQSSKCKMALNIYIHNSSDRLDLELTHLPSDGDDKTKWPLKFTMTVVMLNQTADHGHYQVTRDVRVRRGVRNNKIRILYDIIDNPPQDVQYLVNNSLKFQVYITEKN